MSLVEQIQRASTELAIATKALEEAKATVAPLEATAKEKHDALIALTSEFNKTARRSGSNGTQRTYNRTPESKIEGTAKRAYTMAIKSGMSPKEAEKVREKARAKAQAKMAKPEVAK